MTKGGASAILVFLIVILWGANLIKGSELTGYKLEPGLKADNGWQKMIIEVNNAYRRSSGSLLIDKRTTFTDDYTNFKESTISINKDVCAEVPNAVGPRMPVFNFPIHIPLERKSVASFIRRGISIDLDDPDYNSNLQYPRVKHFKSKLPDLVIEPYQRLMSFAIEVCMIPSIWYLEIIHCMHMAMAPYFTGMLMSYNLQDIVGASIMSLGYVDEKFSIENCKNSVSIVGDDQISPYYDEICGKVEACVAARPFDNSPFSKMKAEFITRIDRSYSLIKPMEGFLEPKTFARFAILTTISSIPKNKFLSRVSSERNFLVIRSMLSCLGYYALSNIVGFKFVSEFHVASFFSKMIPEWMSMTISKFEKKCSSKLVSFSKAKDSSSKQLFSYFCQELFSSGFIYENNSLYINLVRFDPIYPQRILHAHYYSLVPSMVKRRPYTEYSKSWVEFQSGPFRVPSAMEKPSEHFPQLYYTKLNKKTRRMAPNGQGIGPLGGKDKRTVKRSRFRKLSNIMRSKQRRNYVDILCNVRD
ncbi:putative secreted protein [Cryptosporidium canis]|uniref:Secreted protein n=1 Tax=Cryptosporidium canis TaxID=195482 RepID=A0ABQ8P3T1_9CRYT|nr:putative secreted protein [Cryptosporidium canis]KAJ1615019.1 putative secreted protein [Cryptosporidium canis]